MMTDQRSQRLSLLDRLHGCLLGGPNHISTWVNGYQTVDWTDDRPADNNPRKGSKTGKGHLSIQGHDPTTDLSFRNIRIAELSAPKK